MNQPSGPENWPEAGIKAAIHFISTGRQKAEPLSVIDVGGHQGETLRAFANNVDRFSYFSFEPNPQSFEILASCAQSLANDNRDIRVKNAAVGAEDGRVQFHVVQATAVAGILKPVEGLSERVPGGDHEIAQVIDCELVKLDTLCDASSEVSVDLLKIDTEGFDLEVMKGAKNALARGHFGAVLSEVFFVPYRQDQAYFWDLATFMQTMGYHFVNLYDCRDTSQGRLYTGNGLWLSPTLATQAGFL